MTLLGKAGWWIPKWLGRILTNINVDVEGSQLEHENHAEFCMPATV